MWPPVALKLTQAQVRQCFRIADPASDTATLLFLLYAGHTSTHHLDCVLGRIVGCDAYTVRSLCESFSQP